MPKQQIVTTEPPKHNIIADDSSVEGTLVANSDIRVSGTINGTLKGNARVVVSQKATIDGDLHASECTVAGKVKGKIVVEGCLTLKGSAHVDGTISTGRLIVEEGATFNGDCMMGDHRQSLGPNVEITTAAQPSD